MSSLNCRAYIHGAIKVTCMAWHASIAVGEGVRSSAQHPFGVIPRGRPVKGSSCPLVVLKCCEELSEEGGGRKKGGRDKERGGQ